MSSKIIGCGGFKIDNETIKEENGILKAVGSSSGEILFVEISAEKLDEQRTRYTCNKTAKEMYDAMNNGLLVEKNTRNSHGMLMTGYGLIDMNATDGTQYVFFIDGHEFVAATESDYPTYIDEGQS